jgi:hypothetical protein
MQILDPLDPTMLLVYGLIIAVIFLLYAGTVRHSARPSSKPVGISSMVGGRIEEITTGAVQESIPAHLVSIEEERREHADEIP